jgi:hypothetical protein
VLQNRAGIGATRVRSKLAFAIGIVTLAMALAMAGQAAAAQHAKRAAAGSHQIVHNPRGHFLGVVPSTLHRNTLHAASANGTPPLTYHGGPVQHASKVYAIFWVPSGFYYPSNAKAEVTQYFKDVATDSWKTSNVYAVSTQYCQGVATGATGCSSAGNKFASYNVSYGSSVTVTTPFPASGCTNYTLGDGTTTANCLTDKQIQTEVSSVVASKGWATGLGTEFFLFTPPRVGECFDASESSCYDPEFSSGFCAYHSNISSPQTLYAFQTWADVTGCFYSSLPDNAYPNDDGADPLLNVVSHEHNETITDPLGTAWWDSTGFENGDECAWRSLATHFNGIGDYSQTIAGDEYMLQSEWSNRTNSCVETNTFPQPTGTFTTTAGGAAHSVNFTSSVTDSDDATFRYAWTFGDGASSTAANPSHTYASAGSKTVTLTVFDPHGDQLHVVKAVTVS